MSDNLESAAKAEDVEQRSTDDSVDPPWGEEAHDPKRSWNTILRLRDEVKEFKSEAARLKAIREDEEARKEFLAELGYELDDEEDDDVEGDEFDDDDNPLSAYEKRLQAIEEAEQARAERERAEQSRQFKQQFDEHVNELAENAGWEFDDDDRLVIWAKSSQANDGTPSPEATEKAVKEFIERQEQRFQARFENYKNSKKAPAVVPEGKSASQVPDLSDTRARIDYTAERLKSAGY